MTATSGPLLDQWAELYACERTHYGDDPDNKPNIHCYWSNDAGAWLETDDHYKQRLLACLITNEDN